MGFKTDIINLLEPKFGVQIRKTIENYYSDKEPQELYEVAENMLTGLIGQKNAENILSKLVSKYPRLHVGAH
ncbi:MAG: hypothetical protein V1859_10760 [archaeon]